MDAWIKTPRAVLEARESQKGLHWALEILIFAALFFVCSIGEVLVTLPFQSALLFSDSAYRAALETGDVSLVAEATMEAAKKDSFMLLSLFATVVMILLVILFCKLVQKRRLSSLGFTVKGSGMEYLKGIAAGFLMFSVAVLICVLTGSLTLSVDGRAFVVSSFLLFIVGYMIQGMAEEVLCRGYFMVSFGRRYPMAAAVLVNAAAFAALHLLNPGISFLAIINLTLFGIFASLCFIQTENIWFVGALHSVWNLVQGNVYGIKVSGMETTCTVFSSSMTEGRDLINGGAFGLEGGLAVTAVLVAGIAILLFCHKKEAETV